MQTGCKMAVRPSFWSQRHWFVKLAGYSNLSTLYSLQMGATGHPCTTLSPEYRSHIALACMDRSCHSRRWKWCIGVSTLGAYLSNAQELG